MPSRFPLTPPLPPRRPRPELAGPHARWRSLARMLRARHARHAGRQPLDAVLRRPATELFQSQGTRVSSHPSFNCFVTLRVAPRGGVLAGSAATGLERRRGVTRDRVVVVERQQLASAAPGHVPTVTSPVPPLVSRRAVGETWTATGGETAFRRGAGRLALPARDTRGALTADADGPGGGRVFAAPRGLLQTEEAAQAFGQIVQRLRRQESRVTPVLTAVARRTAEAPRNDRDDSGAREQTFTTPRIGMGMPNAMQMQASGDVNIEALASKVMQQIDRRLVAHRERMGRI